MYSQIEILSNMLNTVPTDYAKMPGYPLYDIINSFAIESEKIYQYGAEIIKKLDVNNLTGDELTQRVYELTGIKRREATKSQGILTVTGTGTINAGAIFSTNNNIQFVAVETVEINGTGTVNVEAVEAGPSGDVGANSIVKMPVTIPGITAVTNTEPTAGGYRAENDTELLERFYTELQEPVISGNIYHYLQWALEVPGVGKAKCFPLANGPNTVEVCIIGNDGQPADSVLVKAVQDYIDPDAAGLGEGESPCGAYCTITAATAKNINISVEITLNTGAEFSTVEQAIKDSIVAVLKNNAFSMDFVSYALIGTTIFNTAGVQDYKNLTLNGNVENVSLTAREVAVLGIATITQGAAV